MTITVTNLVAGPFTATGLPQNLPFAFKAFTASELEVYYEVDGVQVVIDDGEYAVTLNENVDGTRAEGGSVAITWGGIGAQLYVAAAPDFDQDQVWSNQGSRLVNLNEALDRAALRDGKLAAQFARFALYDPTEQANAAAAVALAAKAAALAAQDAAEDALDLAVSAKDDAVTAKDQAVVAKTAAEVARDLAAAYAGAIDTATFYANTAAGLAATVSGQYFKLAPTPNVGVPIYLNNAGVAVLQDTLPSVGYIGRYKERVQCIVTASTANTRTLRPVNSNTVLIGDGTQYEFWYEETAAAAAGTYDIILNQYDGTAFIPQTPLRNADYSVLGANNTAAGEVMTFRRKRGAETNPFTYRLLEARNTAVKRLAPLIIQQGEVSKNTSVMRPVSFLREDANTDRIKIRAHPTNYLDGQSKRHSDEVTVIQFNMRDFQGDPGGAPCMNSWFSRWKGRGYQHDLNMMFRALDSGLSVETGQVPTTIEPPSFVLNFDTQTPAQAAISGFGHGYLGGTNWSCRGTLNDPSTGTIAAASQTNPLTIRVPTGGYVIGDKLTPRGVTGMVQINDVQLTVTNVTTTVQPNDTLTFAAVDATAYGAFTGHTGGIDKLGPDLAFLDIGAEWYGDSLNTIAVGYMQSTANENICRYTYSTTYESVQDHHIRLVTQYDFTDAGIVVTPGMVRTFATLAAFTDMNRCRGLYNGVWGPVLVIDKRDDSTTNLGLPDAVEFWHTDFPEKKCLVRNNSGIGKAYLQSNTGLAGPFVAVDRQAAYPSYISNFDWGVKLYADTVLDGTGATKTNMTGKVLIFDTSYIWYLSAPVADPV